MEYRLLGRTGVRVSPLCLGALNFGEPTPEPEAIALLHHALAQGINFVDTSNSYGRGNSESIVGRALSGGRRQHVVLATKFHFAQSEDVNDRGNSRRHLIAALDDSLRRLQTDWVDLYQVHRPQFDLAQDETLRALDDVVRAGKVRYIGCSGYPAWLVMEGLALSDRHGWARMVSEQPPYNILDRRIENELVPLAERYQLALLPWSPLAMGLLAGRYPQDGTPQADTRAQRWGGPYAARVTPQAVRTAQRFAELAHTHGCEPAALAVRWLCGQPAVTAPIIGPRNIAQLDAYLNALALDLTPELRSTIDALVPPGSAVTDFHNNSGWMRMHVGISD